MIIDLEKEDMTLTEALFMVKPHDVILMGNKDYNEKIIIETPFLTLKGREKTRIHFDVSASDINPQTGKKYGTTGSTAFRIMPSATHTTLIDLTIENGYVKLGTDGEQAVAFKSEASFTRIIHCRFLSNQDTFYIDAGYMNYVSDSYIEGDVDFIFGSADCLFENCKVMAKKREKTYYTAPSTYVINRHGLVFENCEFYQETEELTHIGRAWYPSGAKSPMIPRAAFCHCNFKGNINMALIKMHDYDPEYQILAMEENNYNGNNFSNGISVDKEYIEEVKKYYQD